MTRRKPASAGILYFDGAGWSLDGWPILGLDRSISAPTCLYLLGRGRWSALVALLREGDALEGRPGDPRLARIATARGETVIHDAGAWDLDPTRPDLAAGQLEALRAAVADEDLRWKDTGAGVAGTVLRAGVPRAELAPLPVRWRCLAHDGLHQGPQVALRASSPSAILIDQERAYLRALRAPLPSLVLGGWRVSIDRPPAEHEVWITRGLWSAELPRGGADRLAPLPVPRPAGAGGWWCVGSGVPSTIASPIELAIGPSIQGVDVLEQIACPASRWAEPAADRMEQIADPLLRRIAYTRAWGILASRGAWIAEVSQHRSDGSPLTRPTASLWRDGRRSILSEARGAYRPDVAAVLCAYVAGETIRTSWALADRGRATLAAGLDALIVDGSHDVPEAIAEPAGYGYPGRRWRPKARGPARIYAAGVYRIGEQLAASGWTGREEPTPETLEAWAATASPRAAGAWSARVWSAPPAVDPEATSEAVALHLAAHPRWPVAVEGRWWGPGDAWEREPGAEIGPEPVGEDAGRADLVHPSEDRSSALRREAGEIFAPPLDAGAMAGDAALARRDMMSSVGVRT